MARLKKQFDVNSSIDANIDAGICAIRDMQETIGNTPIVKELAKEVLTIKFNNNEQTS